MRRGTSIIFFFLVLLPLSVCGQMLLQGRIVDADTGEPLPYAVISSSSHRTLSNRDGNFSLYAMDSEMLTVSFVGFEKKRFIANKLPAIIYLMPQTIEMQEVIVKALPTQEILRHIRKKIHREWLTRSMKRTLYFFRTTIENADHTNEMMEGFYAGYSFSNFLSLDSRIPNFTSLSAFARVSADQMIDGRVYVMGVSATVGLKISAFFLKR